MVNNSDQRGKRQLLLLAAVFFGPLLLAFLVYYGNGNWRPTGSTEHGELLQPIQVISETGFGETADGNVVRFRGKWSLIIVATEECARTCADLLYATRQIRKALSRDSIRVQRILYTPEDSFDPTMIDPAHPDLIVLGTASPTGRELAGIIDNYRGATPTLDGNIFVADPLGNLMMRFPGDSSMKEIHTDLKKLLKLSRIG